MSAQATANLPIPTIDTPKGTRVRVSILTGYVLHQNRGECGRWRPDPRPENKGAYTSQCTCGKCDGVTTWHTGTYDGTIYWADNAIEGQVHLDEPLDNGHVWTTVHFKAPSGDRCF